MEQAIHQITFSPTGGTRRVSELLSAGFKAESTLTELCTPKDGLKYPSIAADDLVVISMPVGAIDINAPKKVDADKCISCMKCVTVCPTQARGIGKVKMTIITQMLKKTCATRKPNELFI